MIQNVFPTAVGFYNFGRKFTKIESSFFTSQERRPNMGNTTSVNTQILDHPKMKKVREIVQQHIDLYFAEVYAPKTKVRLKLTQSWLNYTEQGEWHHKHSHANSLVSGCLYINAKKEHDKIVFFKNEYKQIDIIPEEFNPWNSDSWWFPIEEGNIVLFPSSLTHSVEPTEHEYTRVSMSFNTFIDGSVGCEHSLTHLQT